MQPPHLVRRQKAAGRIVRVGDEDDLRPLRHMRQQGIDIGLQVPSPAPPPAWRRPTWPRSGTSGSHGRCKAPRRRGRHRRGSAAPATHPIRCRRRSGKHPAHRAAPDCPAAPWNGRPDIDAPRRRRSGRPPWRAGWDPARLRWRPDGSADRRREHAPRRRHMAKYRGFRDGGPEQTWNCTFLIKTCRLS